MTSQDSELTVFAAASLTDAFNELAQGFEKAHPGVDVIFNFAGSNQLATQIGAGAPADVFAGANQSQMDVAIQSGRIDPGAPAIFAINRLVVAIPMSNPGKLNALQDLATPGVLLVLAAPEVPAGRYALEFLDKASADPAFGGSFREEVLANVASYEENVRSVLNKVVLGEADAGIVYASDLTGVEDAGRLEIPESLNSVAVYPIAALNDSDRPAAAAAFIDYVLSAEGQATLAAYGFGPGVRR